MRILLSLVLLLTSVAGTAADSTLVVIRDVGPDGRPGEHWLESIRVLRDEVTARDLRQAQKPWSADEIAWAELIERRAVVWPDRQAALRIPFPDVQGPPTVIIVLGNQGGNDAFAPGDAVIAFDLARLLAIYGRADEAGNLARIDRFYDHEYTHLLHKAWQRQSGLTLETPLEHALWVCLKEGLGNYRSLSPRWLDSSRRLTPHALTILVRLQPVFVARIEALVDASPAEAEILTRDLSMGPFEEKWGALTVALWLAREAETGDEALRTWVDKGPWGVIELARRHLPAAEANRLPLMPRE